MGFIDEEEFRKWITGKSIALVGPAASAEQFTNGKKIDSYDLVARVKSFYVPENKREVYGSRVDLLYTDNHETNDVLPGDLVTNEGDKRKITMCQQSVALRGAILQQQISAVISTYPKSEWFFDRFVPSLNGMASLTNVRILPDYPYMDIRKQTNRPNAGFSAIIDLCSLPVSEIFITGIDFYRSLYKEGYLNSLYTRSTIEKWKTDHDGFTPDGSPDRHEPDLQFKYFKNNFWKKDDRIKVDPFLEEVLSDPRYESFENAMNLWGKDES